MAYQPSFSSVNTTLWSRRTEQCLTLNTVCSGQLWYLSSVSILQGKYLSESLFIHKVLTTDLYIALVHVYGGHPVRFVTRSSLLYLQDGPANKVVKRHWKWWGIINSDCVWNQHGVTKPGILLRLVLVNTDICPISPPSHHFPISVDNKYTAFPVWQSSPYQLTIATTALFQS